MAAVLSRTIEVTEAVDLSVLNGFPVVRSEKAGRTSRPLSHRLVTMTQGGPKVSDCTANEEEILQYLRRFAVQWLGLRQ